MRSACSAKCAEMPVLHVTTNAPLEASQRATLSKALTQLTAQVLRKQPEVTVVAFDVRPHDAWYIGGELTAAPGALLEIEITEGTNLAQEKALFIERVHAAGAASWRWPSDRGRELRGRS